MHRIDRWLTGSARRMARGTSRRGFLARLGERINELAVLKTVGFRDGTVLGIVLTESILIMLIGGVLGLALGWVLTQGVAAAMAAFIPGITVAPEIVLAGVGFMLAAGVLAGIFPALKAMRLTIVDALARG